MPELPPLAILTDEAASEFSQLATDEQFARTAAALEHNGVVADVARTSREARGIVRALLPEGAEVYNNTSQTLAATGLAEDIERSGPDRSLRLRLYQMDREMQRREMRSVASSPDYVVGSAHAVTEQGSVMIASASGSQLGPIVSGAERVILVVGGQKIVPDLATALRRINEYCFPLEDRRAREAYGVPSGVNNILVINRVIFPGRLHIVLIKETLGF